MEVIRKIAVFSILAHLTVLSRCLGITCRNENGNPVDWFYLYKLPLDYLGGHFNGNNGLNYMYLSSNNYENGWQISAKLIDEEESLPGKTLTALSNNALVVAYNDETPSGATDESDGHTKGVVAVDESSGFWLIHSVPKFPDLMAPYGYPKTGTHYGQSFLCISFNSSQADLVGKQLIFNEPNIYHTKVPDTLRGRFPNIESAINKAWRKESPFWNELTISSINGTKFQSFAKGKKFNKELYEDFVAPALDQDLYVETWRHGPGNLQSNCSKKNKVLNVNRLKREEIQFESTSDHSKWAVSSSDIKWICVGDINRAEHQLVRGGGCVCQKNYDVAKAYQELVAGYEKCPAS